MTSFALPVVWRQPRCGETIMYNLGRRCINAHNNVCVIEVNNLTSYLTNIFHAILLRHVQYKNYSDEALLVKNRI